MKPQIYTLLLLLLLTNCSQPDSVPLILLYDGALFDRPGAPVDRQALHPLRAGDTVFLVNSVELPGLLDINQRPITPYWTEVSRGEITGWVPENFLALRGDERLHRLAERVDLPAPPPLYRPRGRRLHSNLIQSAKRTTGNLLRRLVATDEEMDAMLIGKACDYESPGVRAYAHEVIERENHGNFHTGQLCALFDAVNREWTYVNDPSDREYYAKASETIANGLHGDCDDYAILMVSLIQQIGGEAVIICGEGEDFAHAFPIVRLGGQATAELALDYLRQRYRQPSIDGITVDDDGNYWLNLDWARDYPGAPLEEYVTTTTIVI